MLSVINRNEVSRLQVTAADWWNKIILVWWQQAPTSFRPNDMMMTVGRRWRYTFLRSSAGRTETSALSSVLKKREQNYAWQTVLLNYVRYFKPLQLFLLWVYLTNRDERRVSPEPYHAAVSAAQFHWACIWLFLLDFLRLIHTFSNNLDDWGSDWRHSSFDVVTF